MAISTTNAVQHRRGHRPGHIDTKVIIPASVSDLAGWWAADAIAGKSDGDQVAQWNDISGNGYHMTQITGNRQAVYKTNRKNSLPGVLFDSLADGADDGYTSTLFLMNPYTIFCAYAATNTTGNHRVLQGGTYNWLIGPYSGNHQFNNGLFISDGAITAGQYNIFTVTGTATGGQLWKNNVSAGTNSAGIPPGFVCMGKYGLIGELADSTLLEAMVYTRVLDSDERAYIYDYLSVKYAI